MAGKPVTVTLVKGDEKVNSWRYDAETRTPPPVITTLYVRKADVIAMGTPDKITVTLTPAT